MKTTPDSTAKSNPTVNGRLVFQLNILFALGYLVYLLLFTLIFWVQGQPLYILIVATAALNVGTVVGFLYSTFGEEEKKFSQVFVAVNGLLGGATLTDLLQKNNSLIIKCLEHLTVGCGLDVKFSGAVFLIIVTCVPVGFFWLYFNRKLILNPEIYHASQSIQSANEVLNQKPPQIITDPELDKPELDPEVKEAARVITQTDGVIKSESVGELVNLGRSFYELQRYSDAIPPLEKALKLRPNQPDALLTIASAMINAAKNVDAIGILEKLTSLSIVPTAAWKMLGYAYLFYPDNQPDKHEKLEKAVDASRKYLAFEPFDYAAKLNLACAYGQLGPQYPDAIKEVVALIKEVLANQPTIKQRVRNLTQPGQDFEKWTEVKEFMDLLG